MIEFSNVRDSYFKLNVMYKNTYFEDNRKKEILRPIIAYCASLYTVRAGQSYRLNFDILSKTTTYLF